MAYALALLSAALYGAADFLGGFATRRAPLLAVTTASQAIGLLGLVVAAPLLSAFPGFGADLAWGAGAGVCGGLGIALLYHALAIGQASVAAPITAVCSIAIPVGVDLLGGSVPGARVLSGIALGMAAVVLLSRGGDTGTHAPHTHTRRAVVVALAAGVVIGLFLVCLGRTRAESGMWPLLAARAVSVAGFALACVAFRSPWLPPAVAVSPTLAAGAFDVLANAAYVLAARQAALGPVATLASLYPASTVVLARVVWGERLTREQRMGVGLALLAIALITWPSHPETT